jgi:hypothetical protein
MFPTFLEGGIEQVKLARERIPAEKELYYFIFGSETRKTSFAEHYA